MKALFTYLSLALIAVPLLADSPKEQRGPKDRGNETRMLQHLLKMEQAELTELRQTIERIEKMSPEEKELLRKRIGKLQDMPPEHVDAMRKRFEAIPEETREAMREKWLSQTPEERQEWREKLRNMSHEERSKVFEEEGFLPMHGKGPGKGQGKPPRTGPKPSRANGEKAEKNI